MLHNNLLLIIVLLFAVVLLSMLSEKLRIPYPIFLVISGLVIGFIPNVLDIVLQPDLVFLIFLPPLLYAAAWNTSWKDFWASRRPIGLLALGLVIFTSFAVALVSHWLIPDFSLALGFLLGGIISPPDAIAATSVLQKLKIPKRVVTILEGESLVNDASSLIVFRFALVTVLTGKFVFLEAGLTFVMVVALGILIGLAIAGAIYFIHRFFPTTPSIDTAISLIAPYLMYITAEHFECSGVLAVVSGGLLLSSRSGEVLSYNSRLQMQSVWDTLVFMFNGIVFIIIGLQLPVILNSMNPGSFASAVFYGVVISLVTIVVRIIWVFPGTYLPRLMNKKERREPMPSWQTVFIIAWSGMRGVVSLAAALSIPLTLANSEAFPQRNLILFITFVVILFTLVLQGLSLPFLIRNLNIEAQDNEKEADLAVRVNLTSAVLSHIETNYAAEIEKHDAFRQLKERYEYLLEAQNKQLLQTEEHAPSYALSYKKALLELIDVRRKALIDMRREGHYPDEILRQREKEIDHEEARLRT